MATGRAHSQSGDHTLAIVYLPTVPNPTSRNMAFVNENGLLETDIMVEDAVKPDLFGRHLSFAAVFDPVNHENVFLFYDSVIS